MREYRSLTLEDVDGDWAEFTHEHEVAFIATKEGAGTPHIVMLTPSQLRELAKWATEAADEIEKGEEA